MEISFQFVKQMKIHMCIPYNIHKQGASIFRKWNKHFRLQLGEETEHLKTNKPIPRSTPQPHRFFSPSILSLLPSLKFFMFGKFSFFFKGGEICKHVTPLPAVKRESFLPWIVLAMPAIFIFCKMFRNVVLNIL